MPCVSTRLSSTEREGRHATDPNARAGQHLTPNAGGTTIRPAADCGDSAAAIALLQGMVLTLIVRTRGIAVRGVVARRQPVWRWVHAFGAHPPGDQGGATTGVAQPATGIASFVSDRLDQIIRRQHPNVRALLIGRSGRGLVERYYGGSSWDDHANIYGITNTVLSMLIGVALEERAIGGVSHSLAQLLPRRLTRRAPPAVRSITLRQLLTMTSGLVPDPPGSQAATVAFVANLGWVPAS